jgi:hypothetical protein
MTAAQRTHVVTPAVASAAAVHAAITLTTVPQTITTGITSPAVCRVLSITGNAAGIAGSVGLVGTDANGDGVTDAIALNGIATVLGSVAFATLTSITLPARTAAANTVSIGIGDVFGLSGHIGYEADVTLAERMASGATAYTSEAVGTVDAVNNTVAAVIVAGDTLRWTYFDRGMDAGQIAELRQMIAEPTTATYSDADLAALIARYPLIDEDENEPDDSTWTPTYDLNAVAANIWGKKAAAFAGLYDFTADGGTFHRSQAAKEMRAQARYYSARRAPSSLRIHVDHRYERDMQSTYWDKGGGTGTDDRSYVANRAEDEDDE